MKIVTWNINGVRARIGIGQHRTGGSMGKRVAVVTGGIGGLGTDICIALARAGRHVVAADLGGREERIAAFRDAVDGLDVHFEAVDVSDFDACAVLLRKVDYRVEGETVTFTVEADHARA